MTQRYQRQQLVPQIGAQSQPVFSRAKVLIVGMGGLGSPVSSLLCGAGVGRMTLVDHDEISLSNLHRQLLFTEADIGYSKVSAAQRRLSELNSDIDIRLLEQPLSADNVDDLVAAHTVVVDAADSFFVSYLLSDACLKYRIPLVSASVLQTNGYVGVFCGTSAKPAPSMRAIFPAPPANAQSCDIAGVTGPSVYTLGAIQAQEVLKVVLGDPAQLLGKLMYLDLWDYRQNIVDFSKAHEPENYATLISTTDIELTDTVVDVRSILETQEAPFPKANISIPLDQLHDRYSEIPQSSRIVCVCKSGQRALNAAHQLIELGLRNLAVAQ